MRHTPLLRPVLARVEEGLVRVGDSRTQAMRTPAQGFLAFSAIMVSCLAGILHLSWWAAVVGGCVLMLVSMSNHPVAYRALSGGTGSSSVLLFSSFFNSLLISAGALVSGRMIGWAWGV